MALITYDTWMKQTSRVGLTRSPELKALDTAFLNYEKLGTPAAKQALESALAAWKRKQGPGDAWRRSSRNRNRAADKLTALLEGRGDDDTAFGAGRVPDFMHEELVNARLGVLYLFSRLSVAPGAFSLLLDGGLDIASQSMKVAGTPDKIRSRFEDASKGKEIVGKIGDSLENRLVPKQHAQNVFLPANAKPSIEAGPTATLVTSEQILADARRAEALAARPTVQKIRDKIREWFDLFVEKIMETLREKFGTIEGVAGTIKQLVTAIVNLVAATAAPFVSSGLEIGRAIGKTLDAAMTRFRAWKEGRDVEVAQGHPAAVVDSILRAMTLSLFDGLYRMLKGGAALAMDIVGFGAGALVNLLISAGELLIKFIWRMVETVRFNQFCQQAGRHWANQGSPDALHRQPFAFSEWYRPNALSLPLIAVLTLNTGICGDKMRYLTMFKAGGTTPISSDAFRNGVRFLDNLKPWGAKYLRESGFKIRSGGDVLVDRLVNNFASSHSKEETAFDQVLKVVTA